MKMQVNDEVAEQLTISYAHLKLEDKDIKDLKLMVDKKCTGRDAIHGGGKMKYKIDSNKSK